LRRLSALNDFVQLATVEPDSAALWTVVNLDTLSFAHGKTDAAARAVE
jgi:hypothetical protein